METGTSVYGKVMKRVGINLPVDPHCLVNCHGTTVYQLFDVLWNAVNTSVGVYDENAKELEEFTYNLAEWAAEFQAKIIALLQGESIDNMGIIGWNSLTEELKDMLKNVEANKSQLSKINAHINALDDLVDSVDKGTKTAIEEVAEAKIDAAKAKSEANAAKSAAVEAADQANTAKAQADRVAEVLAGMIGVEGSVVPENVAALAAKNASDIVKNEADIYNLTVRVENVERDAAAALNASSNSVLNTLGLEPSDVVKCNAANDMIKAFYFYKKPEDGKRIVLKDLFKLGYDHFYISLSLWDGNSEEVLITNKEFDANIFFVIDDPNDGETPLGIISFDSSRYTLIQNQGEGTNRMPYFSEACYDLSRQPSINDYLVNKRFEKLETVKGKRICVWGDSITWGAGASDTQNCFANLLQSFVNSAPSWKEQDVVRGHEVWNCGVGGDNMASILVRCGGSALYLTDDITLPNKYEKTTVDTYQNWQWVKKCVKCAALPNEHVNLMVQGEYGRGDWGTGEWGDSRRTVNPIIINGLPCIWNWVQDGDDMSAGHYTIEQKESGANAGDVIKAGTLLYTQGSRIQSDVFVFCGGTNGGFDGDSDKYVHLVELAIEASGTNQYVVCSPYGGVCWNEVGGLEGMEALEEACQKRFGTHYFNWRKFLINDAFRYTNRKPTSADQAAIEQGKCPPSFLADDVHPNDYGHRAIAMKLKEILELLNYL